MDIRLASLEHRPGLAVTGEDLVVLTGQPTPYGMLEHLSAEWVLALRELGRRAWLLRTGVAGGVEALQALLAAGRPRAFLAFSGVNWDLMANDRLLYDVLDIPYVGLMFDDPAYFPQRHRLASRNLALLFTDDDHHAASLALSPANAPRGRFRFGVRPPVDVPIDHDERTIPKPEGVHAATDDSRLIEDVGMDSFGMIEVVMTAEEVLGITVATEEMGGIRTLGELKAFLRAKLA